MLDFVRKHAKSWLVKVVLWLIIIVFIAWGGYSYTSRHETEMAQVGEQYISVAQFNTAYNNMLENYRQRLGSAFSDELLRKLDLKTQTLEALIEQALVMQGAAALGLTATTDEIRRKIIEIPVFLNEGKFEKKRYEAVLHQMRLSPEAFEQQIAQEVTARKVESFITNRAVVTNEEALTDYHFNQDQVRLAYVPFDPRPLEDQVQLDDAALQSFYEANKGRYMEPEKREVAYGFLSAEELGKEVTVSDEEVKRYYEEHQSQYTHEKQVHARHILIQVAPNAPQKDVDKARAEAQKILDEAKKGKDFAELAKKHSQDTTSAKQGGDLGYFSSKLMVPEFSEAAFALQKGQLSGLVKTQYGFHIIKVEDVREAGTTPLDQVKADIRKQLANQAALDIGFKKARELRDLAYARRDVEKASQEMKIPSDKAWIDLKEEQPQSHFNARVKARLFEIGQGEISDPFELPNGFIVAQVKTIKQPQPIPFDQVKDRVTKDYRADQAKTLAQKKASDLLKLAREKNSLADAAKQLNLTVRQSESFSRQQPDKELKLLRGEDLNQAFQLSEAKPFPEAPLELGNRFIACQLLARTPAPAPSPEELSTVSQRILQQKQAMVWQAWVNDLRRTIPVERFKKL